ncbi:T9SS type A sorting domain-containing protein [Crocinitomicaceae bacterium]|nr:T9SS type A sorting domain-containing protein [Crocinitomicaceae bacterium]
MKKYLLSAAAVVTMMTASAQVPGDLDSTFGIDGLIYNDFIPNTSEFWWDMIVLDDDKMIKVGYSDDTNNKDVLVGKFKANGEIDSTFANNGYLTVDIGLGLTEEGRGIYEMDNGQLLVTGYRVNALTMSIDGFIMRLEADGSVDATFGETAPGRTEFNGGDNTIAYGQSIEIVGNEIYVGGAVQENGQADLALFNFLMDGTLDNSFSSGGYAQIDIKGEDDFLNDMSATNNGSFVLVGSSELAGLQHASTTLLTSFGTPTGFATQLLDFGTAAADIRDVYVDQNDYIHVAGSQGTAPDIDGFVARFKSDFSGDLDDTWGTSGMVGSNPGATTEMQLFKMMPVWDGGLVVTGNLQGAAIQSYAMMLTATGGFQSDFSGGDVYLSFGSTPNVLVANCVVTQSDGGIVIGGWLQNQTFIGSAGFLTKLVPYQDVTGITEITASNVNVYPNPVSTDFKIDLEEVQSVQLISMEGRVVGNWEGDQASYKLPAVLPSGAYVVKAKSNNSVGTSRIVVK